MLEGVGATGRDPVPSGIVMLQMKLPGTMEELDKFYIARKEQLIFFFSFWSSALFNVRKPKQTKPVQSAKVMTKD